MTASDSAQQLRSLINRILRLKEEQDELGSDIRDIYKEAKDNGYDKTALGKVVSVLRARDKHGADEMAERDALVDTYLSAFESGTSIATRAHAHEAPTSPAAPKPTPVAPPPSPATVPDEFPDIPPALDRRQRVSAS